MNINDSVTMKYKTIYEFILTLMKEEWVFNVFEESAEKTFDLNKLVSATCNDKGLNSLLNKSCKALMMKWKVKDILMNKLTKQMKVLILTLKIASAALVSASLYPFVAVHQPAVVYTL